jgi:hypothetical protein
MKKFLFIPLVLVASVASAQAPNITSYTLDTFAQGATAPMQSTPYQANAIVCNQAQPTGSTTNVINPTKFYFDDQGNAGKFCVGQLGSTWLQALPNGPGYFVTLVQIDNLGNQSARSAGSNPFARQGSPATLTSVRVIP